jgi:hypothetical protein
VSKPVTCQIPVNNGAGVSYEWRVSENGGAYQTIIGANTSQLTYLFAVADYYEIEVILTRAGESAHDTAAFTVTVS